MTHEASRPTSDPAGDEPVVTAATTGALAAGPVLEADRIVALDVLRGVAVLGILLMNIQSFSMISAAYMNPHAYGDLTGANYWVWYACALLANNKFITIFSILFGAGIALMTSSAERRTGRSAGVHYRRMGWLILFGLLHAHLLWYGDILYTYGMCGLAVYLLRNLPPWLLIVLGVLSLCVVSGVMLLFGLTMQFWGDVAIADMQADWLPDAETMGEEIAAYRGGWLDQMSHRVPASIFFQTFLFAIAMAWQAGGHMLIGMALFKLGVLSARRSTAFYSLMAALGLGIGLSIVAYGIYQHEAHDWAIEYSFFVGNIPNFWGSLLVSLGYIAIVMLIARTGRSLVARLLAPVGRMALTNYLMQTIICTFVFYGHGLGLFGQVERTGQLGIVIAVWIAELIWSPLWLSRFRFGPFEWLWRSLTYWKRQPFRR